MYQNFKNQRTQTLMNVGNKRKKKGWSNIFSLNCYKIIIDILVYYRLKIYRNK